MPHCVGIEIWAGIVPAPGGWNYDLLRRLFQAIPHGWTSDTLFDFLVADSLVSTWIFAAAFYVFWSMDDSRIRWRRCRLLQVVVAFAVAVAISLVVRPWISWPAPSLNRDFQPLYPNYFWNQGNADCFPSHSTLTYFTISAGLWPLSRRLSLILSAAVLALVSLPRVYVGGHYPIDILASLALVAAVLALVWRWRVPEKVADWLTEKSPAGKIRELALILWVFELGEGFRGATYIVTTVRHYLFHPR
jgi:membrane-associated phospholipid phosphatase